MTALIAIAAAVSAVIITRGGEVVDDLNRQNPLPGPERFSTQVLCERYEYRWDPDTDTCVDP